MHQLKVPTQVTIVFLYSILNSTKAEPDTHIEKHFGYSLFAGFKWIQLYVYCQLTDSKFAQNMGETDDVQLLII